MIDDVDEALRALVERDVLRGVGVEVAFDAPTRDWVSRRNAPTVNLYLYDIREDIIRRDVGYEGTRDPQGRVTARHPPPRRFKLSYLVTAWTQRPEDEHRLLASLLACFIRHEVLPNDVRKGALADGVGPAFVTVGLPPPQDRSLSDVWSALGGELKPSLDLVINVPFDTARVATAGPPVLEKPRLSFLGQDFGIERPRSRPRKSAASPRPSHPLVEERIEAGAQQSGRGFVIKELPPL